MPPGSHRRQPAPGSRRGRPWAAGPGRPRPPLPFLPFFDCACICRPRAFFDIGPMPGRPMLPAIWLIIFWAWAKRSSSWLTSVTLTPEPLAIRTRREALMILELTRSAGVIDRMIAAVRSRSRSSMLLDLLLHLPRAGQHAEQVGDRAHLADRHHLLEEVLEGEALAGGELAGHPLGLVGVEGLLGLLDEREHVAHAEDARGHPLGVEDVEVGRASRRWRRT